MENIPKAANPVRRLRRRADAHGRSDIISAHARSDIIERGGFILPAAFAISKCGLGTFVPVEKCATSLQDSPDGGTPGDRDPGFKRAPMLTGAPNKVRGRSA